MSLKIRTWRPEDAPALCALANAVEPDYTQTLEEWRHGDEHRDPKCKWSRFVAEWDGEVVGQGDYGQSPGMYHPRKFGIGVSVHPSFEGRGIGSALYEHVMHALAPLDPLSVRSHTREDRPRGMRFLTDRGFQAGMREWESRLDVRAFDPAPFAGAEERVRAEGIEIRTFRELEADPERNAKLHEMEWQIGKDVPSPEPPTRTDLDRWVEQSLSYPGLLPDGWFVAVHGDRYVGCSNLWGKQSADYLDTGLTGVLREYRRKGIALALKLRAIAFAKERGCPEIRTWNATSNDGMLSINVRLGFVRQPAWVEFAKTLQAE